MLQLQWLFVASKHDNRNVIGLHLINLGNAVSVRNGDTGSPNVWLSGSRWCMQDTASNFMALREGCLPRGANEKKGPPKASGPEILPTYRAGRRKLVFEVHSDNELPAEVHDVENLIGEAAMCGIGRIRQVLSLEVAREVFRDVVAG